VPSAEQREIAVDKKILETIIEELLYVAEDNQEKAF